MDIDLRYGKGSLTVRIPPKAVVSLLQPLNPAPLASVEAAVRRALAAPLGCEPLLKLIEERRPASVAIAVPDETRPAPLPSSSARAARGAPRGSPGGRR
jgi:lactate racemase